MINQMQEALIEGILDFDNAQEVILTALKRHSQKNPDEIINVLNAMNLLVANNIRHNQEINQASNNALSYSIAMIGKQTVNNNLDFVTAINNCKILCPDGNTSGNSPAVIKYFKSMLEYLKQHESEYLDSDWSVTFDHNKYLHTILGK